MFPSSSLDEYTFYRHYLYYLSLVPLIAKINIAMVNPAPIAASAIATSGACKI